MNCLKHPKLQAIKDEFLLPTQSIVSILDHFNIPKLRHFETYRGNIDWHHIPNAQITQGNTIANLGTVFEHSVLLNYEYLLLQIGYENPVIMLAPAIFANYWEEILWVSNEGFPLITPDGKYLMEMLIKGEMIYSNFKLI